MLQPEMIKIIEFQIIHYSFFRNKLVLIPKSIYLHSNILSNLIEMRLESLFVTHCAKLRGISQWMAILLTS